MLFRLRRMIRETIRFKLYQLRQVPSWFKYKLVLWRAGISEKYLWRAFTYLAELDWEEFKTIYDGNTKVCELQGIGNLVHIKADGYQCIIQQADEKSFFVQEWKPEVRKVELAKGAIHETNWHDVFRTGRYARSLEFVQYLRRIYGQDRARSKNSRASHTIRTEALECGNASH